MTSKFKPFYIAALAVAGVGFAGTWNNAALVRQPMNAATQASLRGVPLSEKIKPYPKFECKLSPIFDNDQPRTKDTLLAIPDYTFKLW